MPPIIIFSSLRAHSVLLPLLTNVLLLAASSFQHSSETFRSEFRIVRVLCFLHFVCMVEWVTGAFHFVTKNALTHHICVEWRKRSFRCHDSIVTVNTNETRRIIRNFIFSHCHPVAHCYHLTAGRSLSICDTKQLF